GEAEYLARVAGVELPVGTQGVESRPGSAGLKVEVRDVPGDPGIHRPQRLCVGGVRAGEFVVAALALEACAVEPCRGVEGTKLEGFRERRIRGFAAGVMCHEGSGGTAPWGFHERYHERGVA